MNAKNARSAMNVNKILALVFCVVVCAAPAHALENEALQYRISGAPGLYKVHEILINPPLFFNQKDSQQCNLKSERLFRLLRDTFMGTDMPTLYAGEEAPVKAGVARITVQPEVTTKYDDSLTCHSYIQFVAEAKHTLRLPPIEDRRNFTATYWRAGLMISSLQDDHDEQVAEAFIKLADDLNHTYTLAQPSGHLAPEQRKANDLMRQENIIKQLDGTGKDTPIQKHDTSKELQKQLDVIEEQEKARAEQEAKERKERGEDTLTPAPPTAEGM